MNKRIGTSLSEEGNETYKSKSISKSGKANELKVDSTSISIKVN